MAHRGLAARGMVPTMTVAAIVAVAAMSFDRAGAAELRPEARAPGAQVVASEAGSSFVPLGVGKSVVIDLPADVKDVLVADPKIANAVIRSARRAYLIGVTVGQTSGFFFDAHGRQLAGFHIAVTPDLNGVRAALRPVVPGADLPTQGVRDGGGP